MHATVGYFARLYNNSALGASDSLREARAWAGATLVILELKTWTYVLEKNRNKHLKESRLFIATVLFIVGEKKGKRSFGGNSNFGTFGGLIWCFAEDLL